MADDPKPNENPDPNPAPNPAPNPTPDPTPLPTIPAPNSSTDLGSLVTAIAALPEQVARAVRESIPAPTPPANPEPKKDDEKGSNPAPNGGTNETVPGKKEPKVKLFGVPWL